MIRDMSTADWAELCDVDAREDPRRGLVVTVYRPADGLDCTLGGFSASAPELTVVGVIWPAAGWGEPPVCEPMPKGARVSRPTPDRPAAWLRMRYIGGRRPVWSIVPALDAEATTGEIAAHLSTLMFGSNYAACSDSRFGEITEMYGAVAVHDRVERRR